MHKGALRYVADTIAIEQLASGLPIHKEAGLFESLGFSGVASTIKEAVKGLAPEDSSPAGWIKAIANLLLSGALFKLHPLLGVAYTAANALGVDVIGIGKQILNGVYQAVKSGAQVALSDIDYYGKIAVAMYNNGLIKESQLFGRRSRNTIDVPFLPRKGASEIERVFGDLFRFGRRRTLKSLIVAIIVWTLKTALLGAGLLGGTKLIVDFIKNKKKEVSEEPAPEKEPETEESETEESEPEEPSVPSEGLLPSLIPGPKASGRGTDVHKNDQQPGGFLWKAPLYGGIAQTLASWAKDIYEGLSGYDDIIYSSPAFMSMVRRFQDNYNPGETSVLVPAGYTSRKQVVDDFAQDVFSRIKGNK